MDIVGRAFRNESTIVYVESVKASSSGKITSFNVIVFCKKKFGYNIGRNTMRDTAIAYTFPINGQKYSIKS